MATDASITRRSALASMAAVATTHFTPNPAASNTPPPSRRGFAPEPTLLGRRFLRYVSMHRWVLGAPHQDDAREDAICKRVAKYNAELARIAGEILARPVQSVGDLVDRLILAAHEPDPSWDVDHRNILLVLAGALAAAGILVGGLHGGRGRLGQRVGRREGVMGKRSTKALQVSRAPAKRAKASPTALDGLTPACRQIRAIVAEMPRLVEVEKAEDRDGNPSVTPAQGRAWRRWQALQDKLEELEAKLCRKKRHTMPELASLVLAQAYWYYIQADPRPPFLDALLRSLCGVDPEQLDQLA